MEIKYETLNDATKKLLGFVRIDGMDAKDPEKSILAKKVREIILEDENLMKIGKKQDDLNNILGYFVDKGELLEAKKYLKNNPY